MGRLVSMAMVMLLLKVMSSAAAVSLELSATTLTFSGASVNISWSGLEDATKYDWLGIYTPPESLDQHYIGYINVSQHSNNFFTFPAVNMRAPYEFRLFRGTPPTEASTLDEDSLPIPSTETRLAVSRVVEFSNYNEPTQVHLSLTADPSEMAVMYVTRDPLQTCVRYGKANNDLRYSSDASAHTYGQEDMCHAPASTSLGWRSPGYMHLAKMRDLEPGVRYFYQVGSAESGWSKTFSFVAPNPSATETSALLFGDMGTYAPYRTFNWVQYESTNTMKWLLRELEDRPTTPTLVSHIGDISYARGYSWLWDNFFQQVEPVASQAPWLVCVGNHEYDWPDQPFKPNWSPYGRDGGGECGVPYSLRFAMPGWTKQKTTQNLYYSVDFGVVHFVWISTETDFTSGSEQHKWITADLLSTDRRKTPFIVFQGHRPMYSSDNKAMRLQFTSQLIQHLEPLLIEHKVTLALWGHVHKYERTCPLQNRSCVKEAPVHMVIGMGGQDWQPIDQPRPERPLAPIFPQPEWSLFRSFEFGYIRLTADSSLMKVEYVGNHDGQVHDMVEFAAPGEERFGQEHSHGPSVQPAHQLSLLPLSVAFVLGGVVSGVAVKLALRRPAAAYVRVQQQQG